MDGNNSGNNNSNKTQGNQSSQAGNSSGWRVEKFDDPKRGVAGMYKQILSTKLKECNQTCVGSSKGKNK